MRLRTSRLLAGAAGPATAAAAARLARARGDLMSVVEQARRAVATTLRDLASALTARGVPTSAEDRAWHPQQVRRLLASAS